MNFVKQQHEVFLNTISLIASENYSFYDKFFDIYNSDLSGRYSFFENITFQKSFPGHENIVLNQSIVTDKLKKSFNSKYLTISSLSGMNALLNVLMTFTNYGDIVYFIPSDAGGHSSSYKIAKKLGLEVKFIPFDSKTKNIDFKLFRQDLLKFIPKIIYIDQMTGIYPISLLEVNDIIENNNIISYNDVSHNGAFIIGGLHKNPLYDGFNVFGGSTHKTIPGPQKAFIATNNIDYYKNIIETTNFLVSNNNPLNIAILGKVFDIMDGKWDIYTKQILNNSIYFSKQIQFLGFELLYDGYTFSQNHQVLFFTEPVIDSKIFFSYLNEIGIYVNLLPLPFSKGKIGIRVGLQEFTFLGGKENEIDLLISLFKDVLNNSNNFNNIKVKTSILKKSLLNSFNNNYK